MEHPELAYVFIRSTRSIGIVKWGESGYYKTDFGVVASQELIDELNLQRGITHEQSEAMMICSMNNKINGDDEQWTKLYNTITRRTNR